MTKLLQLFGMPDVASAHGAGLDDLIGYVHLLMLLLFVGWFAYFLVAITKFRKSANAKADYLGVKGHMNSYLELGLAIVEAVLLIGFAIPLWARAVDRLPTAAENPVEIQVMAMQFSWNAHFAGPDGKWGLQDTRFASSGNPFGVDPKNAEGKDDVATVSNEEFLLPINRPVIAKLSSMDVIHCFKLLEMRVTQDCVPGLSIPVHFTPTKLGKYSIMCAQLCGNGHSKMRGYYRVVAKDEFDKWYAEKSKAGAGTSFE